jgi:hypothetical protein
MTDIQKEENKTAKRFVLDEKRNVIDTLNPSSCKSYCHEGDPEDQSYLRERILLVRLGDLVEGLIINLQPEKTDSCGNKYKPYNKEKHSISCAIYKAILASQLNTLDTAVSVHNRFDGKLKRQKSGLQEFTSLSLFRDDVERLLRDIYGDIESEALDKILRAIFVIVLEFAEYVRKDLWQEHVDAMAWDYIWGIGLPDGYGISGSDHGRAMKAVEDLRVRVREVRENLSTFSRYTVEFATLYAERFINLDAKGGCSEGVDEVPF